MGSASQNTELLGVTARMLFFLEQCAIDSGKSQFAWLLCGWAEPPMHLMVNHRHRPGLQPFSRLCSPAWVSGNLAYLRDLDYMEARVSAASKAAPARPATDPNDAEIKRPKPKAKKPKGKGRGDGSQQQATPES